MTLDDCQRTATALLLWTALPGAYELHASQSDGTVTYRPDQDCCPVDRERPHWRGPILSDEMDSSFDFVGI